MEASLGPFGDHGNRVERRQECRAETGGT